MDMDDIHFPVELYLLLVTVDTNKEIITFN